MNHMRDFADKSYLKADLGLTQAQRNEQRRIMAIEQLGSNYLCHPSKQVKRRTPKRFIR